MKKSLNNEVIKLTVLLLLFPFLMYVFLSSDPIYSIILWVILLFLPVLITRFIKKRILRPLKTLTEETKRIATGDLSHEMIVENNDEIGNLIKAFDQLRSELAQKSLEQKNFERSREDFVASITHDLKTPLGIDRCCN
ncbi:HAMP domain-containing protein [Xylocopilactobacillus apicola]|uniref:histidine kinase n=1 Tax=Xylocopilactobacillus apicola TaxID=2932184 RepID=A0AAU9DD09_9LACO|nr:HAMP domain-containing protein [Xylocopilactobacillus apicola]BDR58697.1 hypothetical protein XA3_11380 [Xylocopilactobacillus apicola]